MEEQKRRAERDKLAAISALEERSREFMQEKKEKETLERRINGMQSQLLVGGHKLEELPAIRNLLDREQRRIRGRWFIATHSDGYLITHRVAQISSKLSNYLPLVCQSYYCICCRRVHGQIEGIRERKTVCGS